MPHPDMVEIKQGYFQESLHGLDAVFAFVSIGVDLETSIYNRLECFYPRMASGRYIMIHDYNSRLHGVKSAVKEFKQNHQCLLHKALLSDTSGILEFVKS